MEHNTEYFYTVVLALSFLLFVASVTAVFIKKLRIPYTVVLVLIGLGLSALSEYEAFAFLNVLELSPDLVFYLFLPMLIFEGAYNIRYLDLRSSIKTISLLAVVGLALSAFFIGTVSFLVLPYTGIEVPLLTMLLFGALISSTDPIAALAIFKEIGVPKRMKMLLEGESLLNDGTALALFQVIFGVMAVGAITPGVIAEGFVHFWVLIIGGALFGVAAGYLFAHMIGRVRNLAVVEITLTLILAHVTFIVAEKFLSVSGIIATTAAAMVIGNYGRYKISPTVRGFMEHFWEYTAFVSNSLIFLLIGFSVKDTDFGDYVLPVIAALGVVLIARFLSVFAVAPIANSFFKDEGPIPFSWQLIISWGGLRGALPLAIVLLLPYDFEYRNFILILTLATIFFTLVIKAATLRSFLTYLKLHALSPTEELEREEGFLLIDAKIQERLKVMQGDGSISEDVYRKLNTMYADLYAQSRMRLREMFEEQDKKWSHDVILFTLRKHALGMERRIYFHLFEQNALNEGAFTMLDAQIERQINRIERNLPQVNEENGISFVSRARQAFLAALKRSQNAFLQRWSADIEARDIIQDYCVHRARKQSSGRVAQDLWDLCRESDSKIFNDAIEPVIDQYRTWHDYNAHQVQLVRDTHPKLAELVEYTIANLISLDLEIETLKELRAKGIIAENVFADVYEYYDNLHLEKEDTLLHYHKKSA